MLTIILHIYSKESIIIAYMHSALSSSIFWLTIFIFIFNIWFIIKIFCSKLFAVLIAFVLVIIYYLFLFISFTMYDNYIATNHPL